MTVLARTTLARLIVVASAIALMSAAPAPPRIPAATVLEEFKALCLEWGDLETTQELAIGRGYRPAQERLAAFEPGGLPVRNLYIWARTIEGVDIQIVAKPRSFIGFGGPGGIRAYQDVCSVVVTPGHRSSLRGALARHLRQDSFRQDSASVFAWTNGPNGKQVVRRNVFDDHLYELMSERGLHMVTVGDHNDQVILSYFVPSREDCLYRPNYTATEPNIVCGANRDGYAQPET